ncbi:TPA: phage major capsid protein [Vibrio parahaemolyticus]
MPNPKPHEIKIGESFERSMIIDASRGIDEEKRTVEVSFSSEIEVPRWFGTEVLDHSPGAVRLERLNDGGAVLMDHNRSDQVGVVEIASIDADRKGRATLRFGRSERATDIFNDIVDGIRKKVSVHYKIFAYERREGENGQPDTIKVTDWEPTEISIVAVPADASVGVGRSDEPSTKKEAEMPTPANEQVEQQRDGGQHTIPAPAAPTITNEQVRSDERKRIAEISRAAENAPWDLSALRDDAIENGMSIEQFRAAAFEQASAQPKPAAARMSDEMMQRENREYSLVRALNAQMSGDWSEAGFEREMSQELRSQGGSVVGGGLIVPVSIFSSQRADTANNAGLIGTQHMANQFIDIMRANTLLGKLGARFLPGLNGNVSMPKKTASATFGWLAEKENATESDVTTGNVTLSGKHVGGIVPLTFELMRQSSPAIEQIVREDMLTGMALAIDLAGFSGTGLNNQPLGILNTAGVQTVDIADNVNLIPTFNEVVKMEGVLDDANALMGSLAYAFRPTVYSALKTAKKDAGSGRFVVENGECNGYKAHSSTQMPAGGSLFGNFSDVMIGTWGMVELIPTRNSQTGGLDIGCHQMADVAVRNPQSFVKGVAAV